MKKLNKFFAVLVALAMMATLAVTSAFALDDNQQPAAANAKLVKYLELADSVTNPRVPFTFTFTAVENTANTTSPSISDVTITPTTETAADNDANSVYGYKTFAQTEGGILNGVTFPKAGVYTYTVQETASTTGLPEDMSIAYDDSVYTVRFYVDASGNVNNVTATKDNGTTKEDVTTTDPATDDDENGGVTLSGLTFDNKLTETESVTPDPTNDLYGVLNIAKKVDTTSHNDIDSARANDEFKFTLELTKAYGQTATSVAAKKRAADGTTTDVTVNYGSQEITLKAGEALYFETLPAGTTWKVTENLSTSNNEKKDQYQAAYAVLNNAATASASEAAGNDLATGTYTLVEDTAGEKAVYTNTYDDKLDTPEGILISNLPYIALALVAIGGLVAYVVIRRRDSEEA